MTEPLEALRAYVHFLREREGVRSLRLTQTARAGLVTLLGSRRTPVDGAEGSRRTPAGGSASGSRRPPGDGRARTGTVMETESLSQVERTAGPAPGSRRLPPAVAPDAPAAPATVAGPATATFFSEPPVLSPIPLAGSSKVEQLAHLNSRARECVKCPHLAAHRTTVVFGVGNPDAALMFVGEGPGEEEDLKGEPFIGRAGQLLTKMITAMGLAREQIYIANIVKCRPDMPEGSTGNRKPTKQEMETCLPYLRAQIDVIQPRVVVALGATAVEGLIGATGPMGGLRGKFLEYRGIPLMPTYHPSYLLRNQSNTEKRKVWEDLLQVMEKLGLAITDKQRGFFLGK